MAVDEDEGPESGEYEQSEQANAEFTGVLSVCETLDAWEGNGFCALESVVQRGSMIVAHVRGPSIKCKNQVT